MINMFCDFKRGLKFLSRHTNYDESICHFKVKGSNSTVIYGTTDPNIVNSFSCLLVPQQWATQNGKCSDVMPCIEDFPFFGENNWKEFWKICKHYFPLHSVWGKNGGDKNSIINGEMIYTYIKLLSYLPKDFQIQNKKILEIGYGFGGTGISVIENGGDYYGIDYIASDKRLLKKKFNGKERFFEIEKSGIPDFLLTQKYDLIFSINVMQHLTQQQRKDYFMQISQCLSDNGIFVFDCFEWNDKHMGKKIRKNYNTKFFGIYTRIETKKEMKSLLKDCGLRIIKKFDNNMINGEIIKYETVNPAYVITKL